MHGGGGRLAVVDRRDLAACGADDHEPAAAEAARERLDDAEHGRSDDRGVDGVRPVTQRLDGRLRGEQVDRGGRASGPLGGRCLLRLRLRDAGRRKRQQPHDDEQNDGRADPGTWHRHSPRLSTSGSPDRNACRLRRAQVMPVNVISWTRWPLEIGEMHESRSRRTDRMHSHPAALEGVTLHQSPRFRSARQGFVTAARVGLCRPMETSANTTHASQPNLDEIRSCTAIMRRDETRVRGFPWTRSPSGSSSDHRPPIAHPRSGPHSPSPPPRKWKRSVASYSRLRQARAGSRGRRARVLSAARASVRRSLFRITVPGSRRWKPCFAKDWASRGSRGRRAADASFCRRSRSPQLERDEVHLCDLVRACDQRVRRSRRRGIAIGARAVGAGGSRDSRQCTR